MKRAVALIGFISLAASFLAILTGSPASAATKCGTQSPCGRNAMAVAFDKHTGTNGQIVMFGGTDKNGKTLGDTWTYDVTTGAWSFHTISGPPCPRHSSRMAYDELNQEVIMFGGNGDTSAGCSSSLLSDTWAWTGTGWSPRCGGGCSPPPARASYALAWDGAASDGYILLHGGNGTACSPSPCDDTWKWDGLNWTQVCTGCSPGSTTPGGRQSPSMIYDATWGHVILTGGNSGSTVLDGSWEWNGSVLPDGQWSLLSGINSPSARTQHRMAYDENTGLAMVFGGCTSGCGPPNGIGNVVPDQFSLDATGWTPITVRRPSARCCFGLVYSPFNSFSISPSQGIFLFGGADNTHSGLSDFYFYSGGAWCKITSATACNTSF